MRGISARGCGGRELQRDPAGSGEAGGGRVGRARGVLRRRRAAEPGAGVRDRVGAVRALGGAGGRAGVGVGGGGGVHLEGELGAVGG